MLNDIILSSCLAYYVKFKKTTVCSIVIAYIGGLDPQFVNFRLFKLLFRPWLLCFVNVSFSSSCSL